MALQKDITTQTGVTGNYLKVLNINLNVKKKTAQVTLGLFLNKDASDSGKTTLMQQSVEVPVSDVNGNLREQVYPQLKIQLTDEEKKKPQFILNRNKGKFAGTSLSDAQDV